MYDLARSVSVLVGIWRKESLSALRYRSVASLFEEVVPGAGVEDG